MSLKKIKSSLFLIPLLSLISCAGEPPKLTEVWWQLNVEVNPQQNTSAESLSLFVHGEDDDGENDLDRLYLINDDHQLFWMIPSGQWSEYAEQNVTWIGANGIKAPGDGTFPPGNYRLLLIDLAGERDEKNFYLRNNIPPEEERPSMQVNFDGTNLTVITDYPLFQVWFYNEEGALVEKSRSYGSGTHQWNQIARNIVRRAVSFSLYTEPESGSWGLVSGPYSLPE